MKKLVLVALVFVLGLVLVGNAQACSSYDYSDAPGYAAAVHKIESSTSSWQWFGSGVDREWGTGHDAEDDGFTFSNFVVGQTVTLSYEAHSKRAVGRTEYIGVWIDWNQDNYFSSSERLIDRTWQVTSSKTLFDTVSFVVPTDALLGTTWLRARIACTSIANAYDYKSQGEVEDHKIECGEEVPEPGTIALISSLAVGLFGTAGIRKKGRK
jgi:hypothetical protein